MKWDKPTISVGTLVNDEDEDRGGSSWYTSSLIISAILLDEVKY
jgi:hypothetical protein